MPATVSAADFDGLPPEERLALAEALWDSVVRDVSEALPSPAHRAELERRLADSIARPDAVTPWEEIEARALARARR